jgi:hypothetical protein
VKNDSDKKFALKKSGAIKEEKNNNENIKNIDSSFLIIFICMTVCEAFSWFSSTSPSTTLPIPVVKWPFDVSKQNSTVDQEIRIREYRSYYFALRFEFVTKGSQERIEADGDRVLALVDVDMSTMKHKGINIPIHLKISKPDTGSLLPKLIYEDTILTHGTYAGAFGYHLREIIAIDLKPGIYRVEVNTIEDRPEFLGTPTYLQIEPHSQIKFLPGSIK